MKNMSNESKKIFEHFSVPMHSWRLCIGSLVVVFCVKRASVRFTYC